jgi:hypothetical protein
MIQQKRSSATMRKVVALTDGLGIFQMKRYSIVRAGNEYIVQVDQKSILKVSSRRKAMRLMNVAAGLLDQAAALPLDEPPSTACDDPEVP